MFPRSLEDEKDLQVSSAQENRVISTGFGDATNFGAKSLWRQNTTLTRQHVSVTSAFLVWRHQSTDAQQGVWRSVSPVC